MLKNKLAFVFLCFLLILPAACHYEDPVPQRPESVPANAMWVGGIDGGAWVLLKKNREDPAHIYRGEIYGDQAGESWYVGRLAVEPQSKPVVRLDDPDEFGVWDGDNLLLNDGRLLRAIDPYDPFRE